MKNLIRFIQHYLMYLREYDGYMWFVKNVMRSESRYESRFEYAWKNAKNSYASCKDCGCC